MKDGLSLIGLKLHKAGVVYQITNVYVTCLNLTYIAVKDPIHGTTINYPFRNFRLFLNENGFLLEESIRIDYQF